MSCARPQTKIFLDSGDPAETREMITVLGFLDGQTTNPTLLAKSPAARDYLMRGNKLTRVDLKLLYKRAVEEIAAQIPRGSVSIEVYADAGTGAEEMTREAHEMFAWIPNAHIKFPITAQGLEAAAVAVREGLRVNMTLCFLQEQAAAVYSATRGAQKGQVFISPFVGRLDDRGQNGMGLIANIIRMYEAGDGHVQVLAASIRNINHILASMRLGADIITAPAKVLNEWANAGCIVPPDDWVYHPAGLAAIPYEEIDLAVDWRQLSIDHELTRQGVVRFSADWNALITIS